MDSVTQFFFFFLFLITKKIQGCNDSVCFITVLHGGENLYPFHPFKRIMAMHFCRWRCVHSQIYGDTALVPRETPWQSSGAMRQFVL